MAKTRTITPNAERPNFEDMRQRVRSGISVETGVGYVNKVEDHVAYLEQQLAEKNAIITKCGEQFRFYEKQHLAKKDTIRTIGMNGGYAGQTEEEAQRKADVNAQFAELCGVAKAEETTRPDPNAVDTGDKQPEANT